MEEVTQGAKQLQVQPAMDKLKRNQVQRQPQPVNRYFQSLLDLNSVTEATVFSVNDAVSVTLYDDLEQIKISFLDKTIAVTMLPIRNLPKCPDSQREHLVRRALTLPRRPPTS